MIDCMLVFTSIHVLVHMYRRALEAKAAIYARLSGGGGGGVREEEDEGEGEEPRYMVDFTRKIWEEVHVNCSARGAHILCRKDIVASLQKHYFPLINSELQVTLISSSRALGSFYHLHVPHVLVKIYPLDNTYLHTETTYM